MRHTEAHGYSEQVTFIPDSSSFKPRQKDEREAEEGSKHKPPQSPFPFPVPVLLRSQITGEENTVCARMLTRFPWFGSRLVGVAERVSEAELLHFCINP